MVVATASMTVAPLAAHASAIANGYTSAPCSLTLRRARQPSAMQLQRRDLVVRRPSDRPFHSPFYCLLRSAQILGIGSLILMSPDINQAIRPALHRNASLG